MGTVYLIAQPSVARNGKLPNLEPAAAHGAIKVLIEAGEYPAFNPERCLGQLEKKLAKFDPDEDFLVWAGGDTLSAFLAGVVLADYGHDYVWWLRYERAQDGKGNRVDEGATYIPVKVPLYTAASLVGRPERPPIAEEHSSRSPRAASRPDPRQQDLFHPTKEPARDH